MKVISVTDNLQTKQKKKNTEKIKTKIDVICVLRHFIHDRCFYKVFLSSDNKS